MDVRLSLRSTGEVPGAPKSAFKVIYIYIFGHLSWSHPVNQHQFQPQTSPHWVLLEGVRCALPEKQLVGGTYRTQMMY